jgi:DNA invertase Pin-like site-specific DNA recombinase
MKVVTYYRVSTKQQGNSGLGIDGQRTAVTQFVTNNSAKIICEYKEVESGKRKDRPELQKALAHAKRSKATLVVAKLDRLARNVAFTSALMESGADFLACDNPHANRFTIHILAAVAEHEAKMISDRTKAALRELKLKGVLLGSSRKGHWDGLEERRLAGAKSGAIKAAESHRLSADEAYLDLVPIIVTKQQEGFSLRAIAAHLNNLNQTTRTGKSWNPSQVMRVIRRTSNCN